MNKTRFLSVLVLLSLSVFLILACAPKPRLELVDRTPENVLGCALDNQTEYETLACLVRLRLKSQGEKFSGTMEFFFRYPHTFAFHPRTLFGMGGFKATGENDSLIIYFPRQNEFYQGSFSDFRETALWNWKIPLPMVLEMILGKSGLSDGRLRYAGREKDFFLYELKDEGWSKRYWVESRRCRLIKSKWTPNGIGEALEVKYQEFRREGEKEVPRVIIITSKPTDSVTLKFLERRSDRSIPDTKFDLQIPSDARQITFESHRKQ